MTAAHTPAEGMYRRRLDITGIVQGVGFRPFVCRLADEMGLSGHVFNSDSGVSIEVEGGRSQVLSFEHRLRENPPPRARIDAVTITDRQTRCDRGFRLLPTAQRAAAANVPPDVALCGNCLAEMSDPDNRRYGYPFTSCAHCGPRYTIIDRMPFDRAATTMQEFDLCDVCSAEYRSPDDRRFLAETIACPDCGPRIALRHPSGVDVECGAIDQAALLLKDGAIVAVKGIGGFHLLADATNDEAVRRLRKIKNRPSKPFAVMAPLAELHKIVETSPQEVDLLSSAAAPIVLVKRRVNTQIAPSVAPHCRDLGVILPYTPVHYLLLDQVSDPLVVTSANLNGQPIIIDEGDEWHHLRELADAFLVHNRAILRPADDSVCRIVDNAPQILRLGRGYAPASLTLSESTAVTPIIAALGGHLKTAPVLTIGSRAVVGPHTGDLGSLAMSDALMENLNTLESLYGVTADAIACDEHPDYETTHLAEEKGLPTIQVQHHLAHIASVMAEHQLDGPVLGFAWDGTGFGNDNTIWGGETLLIDKQGWRRTARLRPFALIGGDLAAREPRRAALGVLEEIGKTDCSIEGAFERDQLRLLCQALRAGVTSVKTSSAGRLFDACSALLGLNFVSKHEGEAAMMLEACAAEADASDRLYPFDIAPSEPSGLREIDWRPMVRAMLEDKKQNMPTPVIARTIHNTFAAMIAAVVELERQDVIVLSGGCFQNRLLLESAIKRLREQGCRVFINRDVPPGDGGLALGQAFWARRLLQERM